jgi:hypothetical protein
VANARNIKRESTVTTAEGPQPVKPPSYQARGAATPFDSGKYTIGQTSYPKDLLSSPQYGGNYVIFYINVHEDSMLLSGDNAAPTVSGTLPPRLNGELRGLNISETTLNVGFAGAAGVAVYGAKIGSKMTGGVAGGFSKAGADLKAEAVSAVGTTLDVALGAAAAGVAVKTLGGAKKEYKQLQQTIALYIPTDLSIRYGMQWEETDLAGTTAILAGAENFGGAIKEAFAAPFSDSNSLEGAGNQFMAGGSAIAGYGTSQALRLPGIGEAISKTSGVATNPKKEQLFKQVDFRTFTFSYQFFPKSAQESRSVQEIIKMFKLHMHPEFKQDSFNFMYIYPSEFDIYYYHNGKENLNLHRHTSCVLTDMSVVYSPQGLVTMFPDGSPTQINITLTFKELAILTKENIQDGF